MLPPALRTILPSSTSLGIKQICSKLPKPKCLRCAVVQVLPFSFCYCSSLIFAFVNIMYVRKTRIWLTYEKEICQAVQGFGSIYDMTYIIVAFSSRSYAMQAQQIFARRGIPVTVINTPREADGSCGLSVRADIRHRAAVMQTSSSTILRGGVKTVLLMGYDRYGRKIVEHI